MYGKMAFTYCYKSDKIMKAKKYEYIIEIEYKELIPTDWLNKRGALGWELVAVVNDKDIDGKELLRYHFKRVCE